MSETVINDSATEIRKRLQAPIPDFEIYALAGSYRTNQMLTTVEILRALQDKFDRGEITKGQIAAAGGFSPSRVSELFARIAEPGDVDTKPRGLRHDEAVRLVAEFGLESGPPPAPLPAEVCGLVVRHVAGKLGVPLQDDDPRLEALVGDLTAFSRFVADPQVRGSIEMAEGFFRAMSLRPL